jgi:hypothetical protein
MLEILSEDLKTKTKTTNTICKALVSITHLPCPLKKKTDKNKPMHSLATTALAK